MLYLKEGIFAPLALEDIFPNINMGLTNIGFFFGAGASFEAGYPLTKELTKKVISGLNSEEQKLLHAVLEKEGFDSSLEEDYPDIELISDMIYKYLYSGADLVNLEKSIRNNIIKELLSIKGPRLDYHIQLLKSLKRLNLNRTECIWIFTTNYDMLFERAAMDARIPIYNGFEGILNRYFDIERFNLKHGNIGRDNKFELYREPYIRMVKLHGSISWFRMNEDIYETGDYAWFDTEVRSMILPRKNKTVDTLEHPYDKLFRYASQIIGNQCKYILSCGYSFRDQHINDTLIIPKLREGKIIFTALFDKEPESITQFTQFPTFNYLTSEKCCFKGKEVSENSNLWRFSTLVNLLSNKAGLGEI